MAGSTVSRAEAETEAKIDPRKARVLTSLNKRLQAFKKEKESRWFFQFSPLPPAWPFGAIADELTAEMKAAGLNLTYYQKGKGEAILIELLGGILAGRGLPVKIGDGSIPASVGTVVGSVEIKKEDESGENLLEKILRIRPKLVARHQVIEKRMEVKQQIDEGMSDVTNITVKAIKAAVSYDMLSVLNGPRLVSRPPQRSTIRTTSVEKYPFGLMGKDEEDLLSIISGLGWSWGEAKNLSIREFIERLDVAAAKLTLSGMRLK